jgi:hypothetical protein
MARSISTSRHRLLAASTVMAACALLAACGHTPGGVASASTSMSSNAALGPVYFGDMMSFGQDEAPPPATLVAATVTREH